MSFRILQVRVYSRHTPDRRDIRFNREGLSIITGVSRRGKSAIVSIVDYLLISRHCAIPRGVVRNSVSYVSGLFEASNGIRMVVGRAVPETGHAGTDDIHVQTGHGLELPPIPVAGRWNLKSARDRISEFGGIEALPLLTTELGGDEDKFSAANIRHAAPFLFQPQDVIASRAVSFAGLEDLWHKRHVLDAVDYFIGAFDAELLALRRELRDLETQEREASRKRKELQRLGADGYERGQRLLADAIAIGRAPDSRITSFVDLRHILQRAAIDDNSDLTAELVTSSLVPGEAIADERAARARYLAIQHEIGVIQSEAEEAGAHTHIIASGIEKLSLRALLPAANRTECPLCKSPTLAAEDLDAQLVAAASALGLEQTLPRRLHAEMSNRIQRLREQELDARSKMRAAQRSLRALFEYLSEERTVIDELRARERLRGRIETYLTATADLVHDDSHSEGLLARIADLRQQLATVDSLRQDAQRQVEMAASAIARELEVEFNEATRIDLKNLTIQVKSGSKWARLEEFGSGANWVSYHIAGAVGLAQVFAENSAPVPRFIILDQPSQAWFPPDAARDGAMLPADSDDRRAVERLYRTLDALSLRSDLQIIVLDHARFTEEWFEKRVIEDWHLPDAALVPSSWIRP